jgi:large subunit ribosomal protein L25
MQNTFTATIRTTIGKGASRRLRHMQKVPAVIYGNGATPLNIELDHDALFHAQEDDRFYTETLTIEVEGQSISVKVQDMQRHVYKPKINHLDLMRI